MTVSPREQLPTQRGRQTQAAIDAAARVVIARKGFLATTVSDIAVEAGRSTAYFYNYYDSKESMVREWAQRFLDDARERIRAAEAPGLSNRERANEAVAAHWHTYRSRLAEIISVSQLAMVNDDFATYWIDLCALPISLITATIKKVARKNRIFIYYLRNSREATAIAPYSTRAREGATVSVPLTWEELGSQKISNAFTVQNLPKRLARLRRDRLSRHGRDHRGGEQGDDLSCPHGDSVPRLV